jgi:hypothetical protein
MFMGSTLRGLLLYGSAFATSARSQATAPSWPSPAPGILILAGLGFCSRAEPAERAAE